VPADILSGLTAISQRFWPFAVVVHGVVLLAVVAAWRWWRPSNRTVARILVLPLASVSFFAALGGNPFNALVFLVIAAVAVSTTAGMEGAAMRGGAPAVLAGGAMALFGLCYPHFVAAGSVLAYLYRSPAGLLPCPTLSLLIGITIFLDGLGSRTWSATLAVAGLFYGAFGLFRLGVRIDGLLVLGAMALALVAFPVHVRNRTAPIV
jgi:hypothetical protein